jgi:hypothetical protein
MSNLFIEVGLHFDVVLLASLLHFLLYFNIFSLQLFIRLQNSLCSESGFLFGHPFYFWQIDLHFGVNFLNQNSGAFKVNEV